MASFDDLSQANQYFDGVVKALQSISTDPATNNKNDATLSDRLFDSTIRSYQNGIKRTPWIMTTTEWLSEPSQRSIVWSANPGDVSWSMPQRASITKNMFGTVTHVWPNSGRNTFYDEFVLTMRLQSGNLMPIFLGGSGVSTFDGGPSSQNTTNNARNPAFWTPSPGLSNFYDFMQLYDAPKLTADGRANLVIIQYNSNIFPKLTLLGQFDPKGITFSDSSASPASVESWSADFIVMDTQPRLTDNTGKMSNSALLNLWMDTYVKTQSLK